MGTPQVALCAMPLSAGKDLLLYGGPLLKLHPMACGARVTVAVDVNEDGRRMSGPPCAALRACEGCGTSFTGKNGRRSAFSDGSDITK